MTSITPWAPASFSSIRGRCGRTLKTKALCLALQTRTQKFGWLWGCPAMFFLHLGEALSASAFLERTTLIAYDQTSNMQFAFTYDDNGNFSLRRQWQSESLALLKRHGCDVSRKRPPRKWIGGGLEIGQPYYRKRPSDSLQLRCDRLKMIVVMMSFDLTVLFIRKYDEMDSAQVKARFFKEMPMTNTYRTLLGERNLKDSKHVFFDVCGDINESLSAFDKAPNDVKNSITLLGEELRLYRIKRKENRLSFGRRVAVDPMILAAIENGYLFPEKIKGVVARLDSFYGTNFSAFLECSA